MTGHSNGWLGQLGGPDLDHSNGSMSDLIAIVCCFPIEGHLLYVTGAPPRLLAGVKGPLSWPAVDDI